MTVAKQPVTYKDYLTNLKHVMNLVMLQATAVLVVAVIWAAVKYKITDKLMFHICFTTIGYGLMMTESILIFSGNNFFGKKLSRYHSVLAHAIFIGLGSALAIIGISFAINETSGSTYPHFGDAHTITGLIAMILTILACFGGVLAAKVQTISKYITFIRPLWFKICHNLIGQSAYAVGMISFCYGFVTWWFAMNVAWEYRVTGIVLSALITAWTLLGAMITQFNYIRSVFSD